MPTFRLPNLAIIIGTAFVLGAGWAAAGEADELETLVVEGETYRSTATKTALRPQETPGSVSEIDREALDRRGADTVSEALRYAPGITPELRGGGVTRLDQFTIRGFQSFQIAYDGLLLLYNGWNLQPQIDPAAVAAIEVFKGPASVLYGNQPPGGLVNLIAKRPSPLAYHELRFATGTRDLVEVQGEAGGRIGDSPFSYSVVALARNRDGQAVTSKEERYVFAPSLDWQLTADTLINLNLYAQSDPHAGIYNSVPARGSVYSNPNGRLEADFYAGDANYNTFERDVVMPGYKLSHRFDDRWRFLQNARFLYADVYQENTYNTGLEDDDRTLGRRAYRTDESSEGITVDNQLSGKLDLFGTRHHVLAGLDYLKLDSDILYQDTVVEPIDIFAPDNYQIDPANVRYRPTCLPPRDQYDLRACTDLQRALLETDFELAFEQRGIYLQDQVRAGQWVLIAGGRYDVYEQHQNGKLYSQAVDDEFTQRAFTGRAGALYEFNNGLSPYLSYSESFEPVAGTTRNGEDLEPSEAGQWETGIKFTTPSRRHSVTLAGFTITKENTPIRDPEGGPNDVIQAGEVRSRGVELEAFTIPMRDLRLALSATLMDVEVTEDPTDLEGKTPVWVAEEAASLWVSYFMSQGPMAGADFGLGVRYQGETQLDELNTDTVPARTLVDVNVSYDLAWLTPSLDGLMISLTGTNIFDERHYTCFDTNNCWFGEERLFEGSVHYAF